MRRQLRVGTADLHISCARPAFWQWRRRAVFGGFLPGHTSAPMPRQLADAITEIYNFKAGFPPGTATLLAVINRIFRSRYPDACRQRFPLYRGHLRVYF